MFSSKLLWRLYAGYAAIILITIAIVGTLVSRQVTQNGMDEIQHSLAMQSEFLAQIAKSTLSNSAGNQSASLQQTINELGESTQSRLTIIGIDGSVIADSQEMPHNMDNHGQRPEIIDALAKGSAISFRFSQTLQQQMIYRAQHLLENKKSLGFVRVSLPLTTIDQKITQLRAIVILAAIAAAFAALILGLFFAKRFTDPLTKMTEVAQAISQGDYNRRILVQHKDEIGKLSEAFNLMARNSAQRMNEITTDRNRLAKIFTGMVEGVIGVDQHQKIIHINQAASNLLELSMTDCINKPVWQEVRLPEIIQALEQAFEEKGVVKTQVRKISEVDDLVVDIYAAALCNDNDEITGAVIVLNDISELDHLERIRRDFVANASHELKTPITAIRGLAETILDDDEMPGDIRHNFIEKINVQSHRLSQLVSDLLTISRLDSDHSEQHMQSINMAELVNRSTLAVGGACEEKQLKLVVKSSSQENYTVDGDVQAISQLVDNLLDNAVKYSLPGGHINVSLHKDLASLILTVSDTGIGISPQYQGRIFERFYRVDKARSRELGGTGLGLSIVKNIAEQHGGSVSLQSQPGTGSTFTVILPTHI